MNKLREKLKESVKSMIIPNGINLNIDSLEQITDDFTVRFFKWCNVAKYELPNEMSVEEKLQYFKENIYGKE